MRRKMQNTQSSLDELSIAGQRRFDPIKKSNCCF
jgi:hypothetical protein